MATILKGYMLTMRFKYFDFLGGGWEDRILGKLLAAEKNAVIQCSIYFSLLPELLIVRKAREMWMEVSVLFLQPIF